jgi:hypothetical protein
MAEDNITEKPLSRLPDWEEMRVLHNNSLQDGPGAFKPFIKE